MLSRLLAVNWILVMVSLFLTAYIIWVVERPFPAPTAPRTRESVAAALTDAPVTPAVVTSPVIAQRNLFDMSLGQDNLFNGDKRKWSLRLTAVNITNKYALYNFLSTFSGTHYVTPRALNAEIGFHF